MGIYFCKNYPWTWVGPMGLELPAAHSRPRPIQMPGAGQQHQKHHHDQSYLLDLACQQWWHRFFFFFFFFCGGGDCSGGKKLKVKIFLKNDPKMPLSDIPSRHHSESLSTNFITPWLHHTPPPPTPALNQPMAAVYVYGRPCYVFQRRKKKFCCIPAHFISLVISCTFSPSNFRVKKY